MTDTSINHVELIANLSEADRKFLIEKSDRHGLFRLACHFLAVLLTGSWIAFGLPGWQLVMLVHGILLIFVFPILHETVHGSAFATYSLNVWASRICGFLILLPAQWFRYFHFAHHRHTNHPEKDPELASPRPARFWGYVWHVTGIPVWYSQARALLINALGNGNDNFVPPKGVEKVRREARITLGLYVLLIAGSVMLNSAVLLYIWIIPVMLGQPFLRLALLAEHLYCPLVSNMLHNSRTTFTSKLVRWLTWNMSFHAEHHAYPAVPFYRLPEFHRFTKDHVLVKESGGYSGFHKDTVLKMLSGRV
ncbi:MAG: fatty acid desaturase [Pseudomonadota bacterium]